MERLFLGVDDWMNRLHRRYGWTYSLAVFCVGWLALTTVAHFGHADGVGPYRWPSAVAVGLVSSCMCTLIAELVTPGR